MTSRKAIEEALEAKRKPEWISRSRGFSQIGVYEDRNTGILWNDAYSYYAGAPGSYREYFSWLAERVKIEGRKVKSEIPILSLEKVELLKVFGLLPFRESIEEALGAGLKPDWSFESGSHLSQTMIYKDRHTGIQWSDAYAHHAGTPGSYNEYFSWLTMRLNIEKGTTKKNSSGRTSSPVVRSMLELLQWKDEFDPRKINDIVILGNYNLDTFRETLRLYRKSGKKSRIVITGGRGRFINTMITVAEDYGVDLTNIDMDAVKEADLIHMMITQMVQEEQEFSDLDIDSINIELERESSNTPQNIKIYRRDILEKDLTNPLQQERYYVVFIQTPYQQLRSKATFEKVFPERNIKGFSHTIGYNADEKTHYDIAEDILSEAWRLILYSQERGNGTINLDFGEPLKGLNDIPQSFWEDALKLFNNLSLDGRDKMARHLKRLMEGTTKKDDITEKEFPLSFDYLLRSNIIPNETIDRFIETVRIKSSSSPISTKKDVGGIDLNEINVDRQGSGVDIQFDPVEAKRILENGVDGFVPVIINLTPINSILPILGLEPKREEEFELSQIN